MVVAALLKDHVFPMNDCQGCILSVSTAFSMWPRADLISSVNIYVGSFKMKNINMVLSTDVCSTLYQTEIDTWDIWICIIGQYASMSHYQYQKYTYLYSTCYLVVIYFLLTNFSWYWYAICNCIPYMPSVIGDFARSFQIGLYVDKQCLWFSGIPH